MSSRPTCTFFSLSQAIYSLQMPKRLGISLATRNCHQGLLGVTYMCTKLVTSGYIVNDFTNSLALEQYINTTGRLLDH